MPRDKYGMVVSGASKSKKPWEQDYGPNWPDIRERVLKRDGYRCRKCGVSVKGTSKRAVHHIIPLSKGGTTTMSNLQTECSDCHDREHPHLMKLHAKKKESASKRPYVFNLKTYHSKKSRSLF